MILLVIIDGVSLLFLPLVVVPCPLCVYLLQDNFGVLNNELKGELNSYVKNKIVDSYAILYQVLISRLVLETIGFIISTAIQELNIKLTILRVECREV